MQTLISPAGEKRGHRGRGRAKGAVGPDPIDLHVGQRFNLRRRLLNISQEKIAAEIGVTFQQVQKYESGHNRISASRLHKITLALGVPVSFFFEGLPQPEGAPIHDPLHSNGAMRLVRAWIKLDAVAADMILNFMERTASWRRNDKAEE